MKIGEKTLLQLVYEQVSKCREIDRVIVATDDERIEQHAIELGAEVEMTFKSHKSGSDRCAQVARQFWDDDIIINVQGDEPFIDPALIDQLARTMLDDDWIGIASFMSPLREKRAVSDPSNVKVVTDRNGKALYFSRAVITHDSKQEELALVYHKHIGIYGFRNKVLQEVTALEGSALESIERLEQLRWLENGYTIQMLKTDHESLGIDTPEDLELARKMV
jgi:3-deoxy-manno-octulosonate cytidylyltransferase (CMP-KDO synthetase)